MLAGLKKIGDSVGQWLNGRRQEDSKPQGESQDGDPTAAGAEEPFSKKTSPATDTHSPHPPSDTSPTAASSDDWMKLRSQLETQSNRAPKVLGLDRYRKSSSGKGRAKRLKKGVVIDQAS